MRAGLVALLALAGCHATCEQACDHLMQCTEVVSDLQYPEECAETCLIQEDQYRNWDAPELEARFEAHRDCLKDSTCEDIAAGACYDEELEQYALEG